MGHTLDQGEFEAESLKLWHMTSTFSAIIVTTSSRSDRLTRYLGVGDVKLTDEDIHSIDKAGRKGEEKEKVWQMCKTAGKVVLLGGLGVYGLAKYVL